LFKKLCVLVVALGLPSAALAEDLQTSDLVYAGAFRLPSGFDYGARGMSFRAAGDGGRGALIITGFDQALGEWAEVSIPTPGYGDWTLLPEASLLSGFVEFDGSLIESTTIAEETRAGGVECIAARGSQSSDLCYWSAEWWYNTAATDYPAIGMSAPDGSNPRGMWHVGPTGDPVFHGSRHGAYMFSAPDWYTRNVLGGRSIMVGMTREAGCCGSSQGPSLFAFRPWEVDDPPAGGDLDALALVYYPMIYPDCAGPNTGDPAQCAYPDYRACDIWNGGAFVESGLRSAVLIIGIKAYGSNEYGPGTPDQCNPYQGYHCDPLEAQVVFYSTDDIAEAAAGSRAPESIVPYAIWRPAELASVACADVGSMAFDRSGARLFLIEKGFGDNCSAVVHVYTVQQPSDDHPADGDGDADGDADGDGDGDADGDGDGDADGDADGDGGADGGTGGFYGGCSCTAYGSGGEPAGGWLWLLAGAAFFAAGRMGRARRAGVTNRPGPARRRRPG
jgi:hypothetical protein